MKTLQQPSVKVSDPFSFRVPKVGHVDPWFGGSENFWSRNIYPRPDNNFKPPIKSIVVKQRGAKRGIRFIIFESAKGYFTALAANQEAS